MLKLIDLIEKPLSGEWGDEDPTGEGTPVLRTTNFTNEGKIRYDSVVTRVIPWHKLKEKYLRRGDILVEKSGGSPKQPVGRVVFYENDANKYTYNNFVSLMRVKNPNVVYPKYLFYSLYSAYKSGSTLKYQNKTTGILNLQLGRLIEETRVVLPPLDEQKRIAATLDIVSELIRLRKQQLEDLDLLVKSQFIEMFGDPINNECNWNILSLGRICESIVDCPHSTPSYTDEETGYMCIRTSIIKKNRLLWDDIEYIPKEEFIERIQRRKPQKGDIVYSREGAILGIAAIIDRDCDVALGQRSMLLSPNNDLCRSEFLCAAMNFDTFLNRALERISGSASPHINVRDIKEFDIIVPPLEQQDRFAAFVQHIYKCKLSIERAINKQDELRQSLLQHFFSEV